jgi:mannose-6-phosphate isomerase-like protein (cupin superfamily)
MKHNLASTFVVLQPDQRAALIQNSPGVFEELGRRFSGFKGHVLVATFTFDADWSTWERHPAGDEIVCLLSGRATLVLDRDGKQDTIELRKAGEFVVVPQGTWHTARTGVATNMLFVTPGEGTENKPL